VCDSQALCASEKDKAQQLQSELSEVKAFTNDALNVIGELEPKEVAACKAIRHTFKGIGASVTPPSIELVELGGLISWINETSGSLLSSTQIYGDFCTMGPSFQYPADLSTSVVMKASKSTARSFTTNYWCKHNRELALREAEMNRQRVR
jgi:hypothetical protein